MSGPDWVASVFLLGQSGSFPLLLPALFAGLFTAWVMLSQIPALILCATDEQSCLMTAPGQVLVRSGQSLEAIRLVGQGNLIGLFVLALFLPVAAPFLSVVHRLLAPHFGWIVWSAVLFLIMSERPRSAPTALPRRTHFMYTMTPVIAGLATLVLSGLLGLLLYYRSPLPLTASFLNFVPAVIGLFSVPGLLIQVFMSEHPKGSGEAGSSVAPPQERDQADFLHATACGAFAGIITALIPALTGALGALLTQLLTGAQNKRTQLAAQGATRMLHYGAGILLIFMSGTPRMRSSSAALLRTFYDPTPGQVWLIAGVILTSAMMAWVLLPIAAKALLQLITRHGTRPVSLFALAGILFFVVSITSWPGLLILLTASGIGLIPPLFQARPIMAIGVVLVPTAIMLKG